MANVSLYACSNSLALLIEMEQKEKLQRTLFIFTFLEQYVFSEWSKRRKRFNSWMDEKKSTSNYREIIKNESNAILQFKKQYLLLHRCEYVKALIYFFFVRFCW